MTRILFQGHRISRKLSPMAQEGNPAPSSEALSRASWMISVSIACYHIVKIGRGLGVFERHLPDDNLPVNLFAEKQNDHDDLKGPEVVAPR